MIKNCKNCNEVLKGKIHNYTKFCCRECFDKSRRLRKDKPVNQYTEQELKEYNSKRYKETVLNGYRRKYNIEYYKKNKEKLNEYNKRHYQSKKI